MQDKKERFMGYFDGEVCLIMVPSLKLYVKTPSDIALWKNTAKETLKAGFH